MGRKDLPEDCIVEPKILVPNAVTDTLYLSPRLCWEFGEPIVRDLSHRFGNGLDLVCCGVWRTGSLRNACSVVRLAISRRIAISAKQSRTAIVGSRGIR